MSGRAPAAAYAQRSRDELVSQGAFYGMSRQAAVKRADELIESLGMGGFATQTVQRLSGGQKRRLDIALGLMHAPTLLFLDEPSTGLDPQSRANLWDHILTLRAEHGTTVFLTTHYLEEADRYAERVMVMDRGRVIADDTAAGLKANLAGDLLTFGFASEAEAQRAAGIIGAADRTTGAAPRTVRRRTDRPGGRRAPAQPRPCPRCRRHLRRPRQRRPTHPRRRLPRPHRTHPARGRRRRTGRRTPRPSQIPS